MSDVVVLTWELLVGEELIEGELIISDELVHRPVAFETLVGSEVWHAWIRHQYAKEKSVEP